MFSELSATVRERLAFLESVDRRDRTDGTPRSRRLRQIPPETGRFLALLAANCPPGRFIEIGTSAGYSSVWIAQALRNRPETLETFEVLPEKARLARETFATCGLADKIDLVEGDFLDRVHGIERVAFCFLDCEKDLYEQCFDIVAGTLVPGGLLVADNAIDHREAVQPMIEKAEADDRFDCVTVPIGKGEFVCRRK
jgi:predicted O-methyltransferase YrrM